MVYTLMMVCMGFSRDWLGSCGFAELGWESWVYNSGNADGVMVLLGLG